MAEATQEGQVHQSEQLYAMSKDNKHRLVKRILMINKYAWIIYKLHIRMCCNGMVRQCLRKQERK